MKYMNIIKRYFTKGVINPIKKNKHFVLFVGGMVTLAILMELKGIHIPTLYSLALFLLAIAGDFLTTYLCMRKMGTEGAPVAAFLFKKFGTRGAFLITAMIWAVIIYFRWLPSATTSQTAVAVAYCMVPINNLVVLIRLTRKQNRKNALTVNNANKEVIA